MGPPTLQHVQVYPTGVRSFFHGMSAAAGKVGALVAAAAFSNVSGPAFLTLAWVAVSFEDVAAVDVYCKVVA